MQDLLVLGIILLIIGFALRKVMRNRKRGVTCSSCPQTKEDDCNCH